LGGSVGGGVAGGCSAFGGSVGGDVAGGGVGGVCGGFDVPLLPLDLLPLSMLPVFAVSVDCSDTAGLVVSSDSSACMGSSLGSDVSEDSPSEKEDVGATGSFCPALSSCCEQPINAMTKTAIITKMFIFLILCTAFLLLFYRLAMTNCNSANRNLSFSAG
jgi:hypothetical protein